tara:strand:- start:34 stop:330 length:297 start_codon:yes stop_codon:yes gene_type:complete
MKLPTIFYDQAVKSLRPNANWANKNGELIYFDDDCPTDIEIEKKAQELQAEYDAKSYARARADAYPPWQTQMDLLYHGGLDALKAELKKTKDKYPKPE